MDILNLWLLDGPAWVRYRTRRDLLRQSENEAEVIDARKAMIEHPQIRKLVADLAQWPGPALSNHKNAGHPLHLLTFAADLGLQKSDPGMGEVIDRILKHRSSSGPFQVLLNIPTHFGGTGRDQWTWFLCDAPLVLYALLKFGIGDDPRVGEAVEHFTGLIRENGWPCAVSTELKFRGPGRKDDPCPYANLLMLKLLAQLPRWRNSKVSHTGAETLLTLWEERRDRHPYLFYMGTDFCKLKAPLVWYDILHVVDVLTQFPWLRQDTRLRAMVRIVNSKADKQGRFTPESIWTSWKDWDFGQKHVASGWLTLVAQRALKRAAP